MSKDKELERMIERSKKLDDYNQKIIRDAQALSDAIAEIIYPFESGTSIIQDSLYPCLDKEIKEEQIKSKRLDLITKQINQMGI